jgi:DNA mismatch endonuclease (patch repair protein)
MAEKISKETRSRIMSKIRSKNTKPELILKKLLKGTHLRQHPNIEGKPDFGSKSKKIAIFIDGCFWHKCKKCYSEPKSNKKYWLPKIERNVQRAKEVNNELRKQGFRVIRVWEHEVTINGGKCLKKVLRIGGINPTK